MDRLFELKKLKNQLGRGRMERDGVPIKRLDKSLDIHNDVELMKAATYYTAKFGKGANKEKLLENLITQMKTDPGKEVEVRLFYTLYKPSSVRFKKIINDAVELVKDITTEGKINIKEYLKKNLVFFTKSKK